MSSNIALICEISKPEIMFEININNIYLLSSMGLRDCGTEDDIDRQINKLQSIRYKFNINEVLIFRTFDPKKILFYIIMENKLYIFNSKKIIYNAMIYIDNYVVIFFENNEVEVINYKKFTYIKVIKNTNSHVDYMSLSLKLIEDNMIKENLNIKYNIKPIALPYSKVIENDSIIEDILLDNGSDKLMGERIWGIFTLQKNPCYSFSIIKNNIREFQYFININNEKVIFPNILNLITFLNEEFYNHIKQCSYLI